MLKNSKVVLFVTLKSWSDRKLLDPTTYLKCIVYDMLLKPRQSFRMILYIDTLSTNVAGGHLTWRTGGCNPTLKNFINTGFLGPCPSPTVKKNNKQ